MCNSYELVWLLFMCVLSILYIDTIDGQCCLEKNHKIRQYVSLCVYV